MSLGVDNGSPELLAGMGYLPRKKRPHIYIYELPPKCVRGGMRGLGREIFDSDPAADLCTYPCVPLYLWVPRYNAVGCMWK